MLITNYIINDSYLVVYFYKLYIFDGTVRTDKTEQPVAAAQPADADAGGQKAQEGVRRAQGTRIDSGRDRVTGGFERESSRRSLLHRLRVRRGESV